MKKINIDELKKENIYTTPPHFFEEVQNNVLAKLKETPKKSDTGVIIPILKKYSIAATLLILLSVGALFVFNSSKKSNNIAPNTNTYSLNTEEYIENTETKTSPESISQEEIKTVSPNIIVATTQKTIHQNDKTVIKPQEKTSETTENFEQKVDEILSSYTSNELAVLTKQTEQDVYLDIFNY